jgi:deoxyadenosine/deoxycytidine kinase
MAKRFLLVAGNIGAGKTTLTDRIATRLGWEAAYESVEDNLFLSDFYADMDKWAFHLQIYFLGNRAEQHLRLANGPNSAIIDRSIYEDAHIFARALHEQGSLTEREYLAYRRVFDLVVDWLPRPDLLLFLDASVDTLMDRIYGRGRNMESGITAEYLGLLGRYYEDWVASFDMCPLLRIPADDLNFVNNDRHISIIIDAIDKKLAGREDIVFPD